jgi:hypothetical protein
MTKKSEPESGPSDADTPEPIAYARMPTVDFHRVARTAGVFGNPHGLRVAMGRALVIMADSGDYKDFFKKFGQTIISELPRGKSAEEKSAAVVNTTTEMGLENFATKLDKTQAKKLKELLDALNL